MNFQLWHKTSNRSGSNITAGQSGINTGGQLGGSVENCLDLTTRKV